MSVHQQRRKMEECQTTRFRICCLARSKGKQRRKRKIKKVTEAMDPCAPVIVIARTINHGIERAPDYERSQPQVRTGLS